MQERHSDPWRYFQEQELVTRKHVLPFLQRHLRVDRSTRVLEIGCGEGGNLVPFIELGCECVGVDLDARKIENARAMFVRRGLERAPELICRDIYALGVESLGDFDLIFMRDVIEHIPEQERFLVHLRSMVRPGGRVFFGFPPWQMPFGGHQQICASRVLSLLPYYHLLPARLYERVLRSGGESPDTVQTLMEVKATGISIEEFRGMLRRSGYAVEDETLYLINPGYEIKFGLTPREQLGLIGAVPYLRNFLTTCNYTLAAVAG